MKLQMENICKSFGDKQVLKSVSFAAEGGKACGLLGRNGAGKTTSIRILMDVFKADSGNVLFDCQPIDYDKVRFGYLPEERGLYPKKKIFDQLMYFAQLHGMDKKEASATIDYWLDRLGMIEYKNKRLDTLSKGNQQKIQLVTALAHDPHVVILDEPFSGLDPVNAMLLKDVVKEIIAKGKIVLFSSHQMNYIEEFCDSIAIIHHGEVVLHGDLHDIKRAYPRNKLIVRSMQADDIAALFPEAAKTEADTLLLTLDSADQKQAVMRELSGKFDLDSISVYEPSLNDIFVEYAKDDEEANHEAV